MEKYCIITQKQNRFLFEALYCEKPLPFEIVERDLKGNINTIVKKGDKLPKLKEFDTNVFSKNNNGCKNNFFRGFKF